MKLMNYFHHNRYIICKWISDCMYLSTVQYLDIILSNVVLPSPFLPIRPYRLPNASIKSAPWSNTLSPYATSKFSILMSWVLFTPPLVSIRLSFLLVIWLALALDSDTLLAVLIRPADPCSFTIRFSCFCCNFASAFSNFLASTFYW